MDPKLTQMLAQQQMAPAAPDLGGGDLMSLIRALQAEQDGGNGVNGGADAAQRSLLMLLQRKALPGGSNGTSP